MSSVLAALVGFAVGYAVRSELDRRAARRLSGLISRLHEERLKALKDLRPAAPGRPGPRRAPVPPPRRRVR